MPRQTSHARILTAALAAVCALASGCAGLGLPRIDPTGERVFVWPKDQVAAAPIATLPGNVVAPPVVTDPFFPPGAAAPVAAAPGVVPASVAIAPVPQDTLTITPERVLAPVGSEVVLKTSICTADGYTLADQKVEWMLGRNGVGQFVELGGKGFFHPPLLPWNKGSKVDNYLANGYTANGPLCITRGTADPTDDVNINRGDAWISVTSPNEGTSHVTAYTPKVESWEQRKASAMIYWVDVQWTFPQASIAGSGRPELLTTTVTRQTDGTPIEGWLVRYVVADGGAVAGAAQTQEIRTGADGRASVEVAPTASGAASSRIDVELIRPAGHGGGDAPRLIVARGTSIVSWSSGAQPYLPADSGVIPSIPPITNPMPGTNPGAPIQPYQPAQPPAGPAGQARLEVDLVGDTQATVGGQARYRVTIRNVGNAPATGIKITDRFPAELRHFADDARNLQIEWPKDSALSLAPGEEKSLDIPFDVLKPGQHCHTLTVNYDQGAAITKQACVAAVDQSPQRQGAVSVKMEGPTQQTVGRRETFTVTVTNTGQMPLVDVEVIEEYPTLFFTATPTEANAQVVSGTIRRVIPRLEVGQPRTLRVECLALQPTRRIGPMVRVKAQTDPPTVQIPSAAQHFLEILPASGGAPPTGTTPPPAAAGATLSVRVAFAQPTVQAGVRTTCEITVSNLANAADGNVALRVVFPPGLTPDVNAIQGPLNVTASLEGDKLTFTPLAVIGAKEQVLYRIPINTTTAGVVQVTAGVYSRNVPEVASSEGSLEILGQRL